MIYLLSILLSSQRLAQDLSSPIKIESILRLGEVKNMSLMVLRVKKNGARDYDPFFVCPNNVVYIIATDWQRK